ncbi:LicD family protein [Actinomyces capricornis]|uniref:Phosphorylcholine transferase LicD n=1 Tax=Actinomyces capricornis TaxID=2755559 RepID=A0ABN6K249_9ACTO|nr:LicD family protein [Actinomyces capricornis]BDA63674.1 phosphorylcholine transferase LicD [Actinomyces capricornis]
MGSLSLEEIKKVELDCLRELDRLCAEHGLTYVLAYGTLIGALRHEGFIPWDDDIDVHMPRADYERLYRLYQDGALDPRFTIASYRDRSSIYPFFKLVDTRTRAEETFIDERNALGLWVDIFPLERVDLTDPRLQRIKKRASRLVWWRHLAATDPRYATSTAARLVKRLIHPFTRRIDPYDVARKADALARSAGAGAGARQEDLRYVLLTDDSMDRNILAPDDLLPARRATFEGQSFAVPARAEEVLTSYYGDWRRVPPPEERPPSHLRSVTWVHPEHDGEAHHD